MAIANFTDLKTTVADYLARGDLTSVIPDLIILAESTFNREFVHWRMETRTTLATTAADAFVTLPTDYVQGRSLVIQGSPRVILQLVDLDSLENEFKASANQKPTKYSIIGNEIRLGAIPDSIYTIDFTYYARIPDIATNTTNWLLTNHPDVYIYGTLLEAAPYIQDDVRISTWGTLLQRAIDGLNEETNRVQWSGGTPSVSFNFSVV